MEGCWFEAAKGRVVARRRETVIHNCSISERMVKMMFAAGDSPRWGGAGGGNIHTGVLSHRASGYTPITPSVMRKYNTDRRIALSG